jgi:hypothetical protein
MIHGVKRQPRGAVDSPTNRHSDGPGSRARPLNNPVATRSWPTVTVVQTTSAQRGGPNSSARHNKHPSSAVQVTPDIHTPEQTRRVLKPRFQDRTPPPIGQCDTKPASCVPRIPGADSRSAGQQRHRHYAGRNRIAPGMHPTSQPLLGVLASPAASIDRTQHSGVTHEC